MTTYPAAPLDPTADEFVTPDEALTAVLDELAALPLSKHAAFLALQADDVIEAVRAAAEAAVDAAEQMAQDFAAREIAA